MQFFRVAVMKFGLAEARAKPAPAQASMFGDGPTFDEGDLEALRELRLVRALGSEPPQPKQEHVDVDGRLVELGLSAHLPSVVWPEISAIRELCTKIKAVGKTGQEHVFIAVDLRKYV